MSKIIPVSITTTEQAVTLDATYQFAWLRNMGENDCLLSDHSDIVAGDDDVMTVKAGESGRIATSGRAVYIKTVDGTSTGEIHAQNFSDAPFKSKGKGGGQSITVEPLIVTDNGVYTAPTGKAYSPVTVDVETGMKAFLVTLTETSSDEWTSDKTFAEILEAYENGELIIAETHSLQLNTGFALASVIPKAQTPQGQSIPTSFIFSYESLGDGELYVLQIGVYDDGEIISNFQTFTNY